MKVMTPSGSVFDIEKSPLAQILVEGGLCSVVPNAVPPAPIVWTLAQASSMGGVIIVASRGNVSMNFGGVDAPNQKFQGESCPAEIAAQYRAAVKLAPQLRREALAKYAEDKRRAEELACR